MKINVKMKAEFIYDLLLFHTYSKFSGFVINVLGFAVMVTGGLMLGTDKIGVSQALMYMAAGVLFLSYTQFTLKSRAKKLVKEQRYQSEIEYGFDEDGISEGMMGKENHYTWSQVEKAISTPKNIAFYVGNEEALIIPKESFGEHFMSVMKLIIDNVTIDKIYIRR